MLGIQFKNLPTTSSGDGRDYLAKDDFAGAPGSTKKISATDFIKAYFISVISTEENITATAGGQVGAAQLTAIYSFVDSVPVSGYGVKLFNAVRNTFGEITNDDTTNDLYVYPASGQNFKGQAADAPFILGAGNKLTVICCANGEWRQN